MILAQAAGHAGRSDHVGIALVILVAVCVVGLVVFYATRPPRRR